MTAPSTPVVLSKITPGLSLETETGEANPDSLFETDWERSRRTSGSSRSARRGSDAGRRAILQGPTDRRGYPTGISGGRGHPHRHGGRAEAQDEPGLPQAPVHRAGRHLRDRPREHRIGDGPQRPGRRHHPARRAAGRRPHQRPEVQCVHPDPPLACGPSQARREGAAYLPVPGPDGRTRRLPGQPRPGPTASPPPRSRWSRPTSRASPTST